MKISIHPYDLRLRHVFTISRNSKLVGPTVILRLEHDGITGFGEAATNVRYGETQETAAQFLGSLDLRRFENPSDLDSTLDYVAGCAEGNSAAKAAVDIALHDWIGKRLGIPVWRYLAIRRGIPLATSFTIAIDTIDAMLAKVREADPFPILKIKVGTDQDREIISAIRSITDKPIRVDANEGWKNRELALDRILWMEEQGIELVEQPMPAEMVDDCAWLRERIHVPLIADESVKMRADILHLGGAFDGINIKLMKSTGLREALAMIRTARSAGMKVMLGCMIESSAGIAAAAALTPLADYADLDGNLLITNDPFAGLIVENGSLMLNESPGLGIEMRKESSIL